MIVSGIYLKGNLMRIVTLSGTKESHDTLATNFHKLELSKNPTQEDVTVLLQTFQAYCRDNSIEKIVINKRAVSGQSAGGAATFRFEGILLAISQVPIEFVHSATVL